MAERGVELIAPYQHKGSDPDPKRSAFFLSRLGYRIDTVFSQLVGRYLLRQASLGKDLWHLASRLLRKVLSHTVAFVLNHRMGNQPLQLSKLLAR